MTLPTAVSDNKSLSGQQRTTRWSSYQTSDGERKKRTYTFWQWHLTWERTLLFISGGCVHIQYCNSRAIETVFSNFWRFLYFPKSVRNKSMQSVLNDWQINHFDSSLGRKKVEGGTAAAEEVPSRDCRSFLLNYRSESYRLGVTSRPDLSLPQTATSPWRTRGHAMWDAGHCARHSIQFPINQTWQDPQLVSAEALSPTGIHEW